MMQAIGRRFGSRMRLAVAAIIIVAIYIVAAGSVSTTLSSGDLQAIGMLRGVETCRDRLTFDAEIRCLRVVQAAVLAIAPGRACAAKGVRIEPLDFVRRGYGCCFDRARFIEKALSHYGFSTRRVAMYERRRGWIGFLIPGIDSHAASEVRTRRGWLAVDSEQPFMLITRGGRPLQFDELHTVDPRTLYTRPTRSHSFGFENAYFVVRGLYSRHGQSHGVRLPAPEINYPDFLRYAVFGRD